MDNDSVSVLVKLKSQDMTKQLKNLNKESKITEKNIKAIGNEIKYAFNKASIVAWVGLLKKVTETMMKAGKAQTEYTENLHLLQVAYGKANSSGEKLVKHMSTLSGLDISQLTKSLGKYRQLANALGITGDSANLLSENLLKMQNDIASLYNMDVADVGKKLMSALTGETEAIKILGADVTTTALQQKAYNLGIQESITNMSQAEKTILRYLAVQDQLSSSQGDFANTINSVANQTRIWNAQLDTLYRQLGSIFNAILKPMLPYLNGMLMAINTIIATLLGLFGIKSDVSSISSDFLTLGTNISKAGEAGKEANKSLRGFDKLNVIKTPTKSSTSGGAGGVGGVNSKLLAQLKEYNDRLEGAKKKATEIRDKILGWLGFTKEANDEFKFTGNRFDKIKLALIGIGVATLFVYPIYKVLKKIFGLFGGKSKKLKETSKELGKVGKATGSISNGFSDMLKSFGKASEIIAILGGLALVIKEITKLIDTFAKSSLKVSDVFKLVASVLGSVAVAFTIMALAAKKMDLSSILGAIAILGGLSLVLKQVNDLIKTMAKNNINAGDVTATLVGIMSSLLLVMGGIALVGPAMTAGLIPFLAVIGGISALLLVMKATIPTILDATATFIERTAPSLCKILDIILNGIVKIIDAIGNSLPKVIKSVGDLFTSIFNGMSKVIETVGNSMKGILNTVKDLVVTVLREVLNFIKQLGPAIETFVNSAIRVVTKLINFMISGMEFLINTTVIAGLNTMIKGINNLIPGNKFDLNKLQQKSFQRFKPKLYESGGFPTKGDMFIANEKAPEYVGSIDNKPAVANQNQIVDGISTGVARAMLSIKQPKQPIVIEATGDTKGLLDFIKFKEKERERQYGL